MMRTNASLHADQARWHVGKSRVHLATRPLLPQHDRPALIKANNVERVLTNIDAHYDDRGVQYLRHGVLLVFGACCQLRSLAGQEHGRTIPLTEVELPTRRLAVVVCAALRTEAARGLVCSATRVRGAIFIAAEEGRAALTARPRAISP